nr:MAG TPA: hypothetical protein [Caudoviricetes sp.]
MLKYNSFFLNFKLIRISPRFPSGLFYLLFIG